MTTISNSSVTMRFTPSVVVSLVFVAFSLSLLAQDWNQWRGPSRTGATAAFKAPAAWPDRPKQVWQVQAGEGHASPIVSGNRVYAFSRIGDREAVTAYELATGKQLWRQTYDAPFQMNPAATSHGKGPKSTPVIDGGRLYTFGISGILSAWDAAAGKLLWRKDFKGEYRATWPDFGTAMSPAVASNLLILHAGGKDNGALLAIDVQSGNVKWSWKRDGPAYSSPIVATFGGVRQVVTQSQTHVIAIALDDGRLLWDVPFTTEYDQNIVTPVAIEDLLIYSGISKPTSAVRPSQNNGKWVAEQAWQNADVPMYMSSPVVKDGLLFGFTHRNRGQFFCLDGRTGKTLWTTRGREGENAAVVVAGDVLMATTTEGELVVSRPNAKAFDQVKRYTIADSPIWAHPAPVGNGVLIKDAATLAYWVF
jgi:outer membrane protein assembly factor BamB